MDDSDLSETEESKEKEDPEIARIREEMARRKAEALAPKASPHKKAAPEPEEVHMRSPEENEMSEASAEDGMEGMEDDDLELSRTLGKGKTIDTSPP